MLQNLKIIVNKNKILKNINKEIAILYYQNKNSKRKLDEYQQGIVNDYIISAANIKKQNIEQVLYDVYSNCQTLFEIVPENFRERNIIFDMTKNKIYLDTGEIICEINSKSIIKDSFCYGLASSASTLYHVLPSKYIEEQFETFNSNSNCEKYYNTVYELHLNISKIPNLYDRISEFYNIYLEPSFYYGFVKRNSTKIIEAEFFTEYNNDERVYSLFLTQDNIHQQLDNNSIINFLFEQKIYSSLIIDSQKDYKRYLKSIKRYTTAIRKIFTIFDDDLISINKPYCLISFRPADKEYEKIIDGEFIFIIKNFIDNEDISITVNAFDIFDCNINKILECYYQYNRKLRSIMDKDVFLEHTEESLKVLFMSYY